MFIIFCYCFYIRFCAQLLRMHLLKEGLRKILTEGLRKILREGLRKILTEGLRKILTEGLRKILTCLLYTSDAADE